MIKKNPETYREMKALNNILQISKYYNTSDEVLNEAYDFIMKSPDNSISCSKNRIKFVESSNSNIIKEYITDPVTAIDGLNITSTLLTIIPHYNPSSYSYGGGSSSNNNNNNNNNNNH